jgi:hypothetical protein
MRLRINKHFSNQLANVYLPDMVNFADARLALLPTESYEYLNMRIVTETVKGLHKKMQIRVIVSVDEYCFFRLTDAETICLYKYLLNHPIPAHRDFELHQRDTLLHMLHKYLSEPVPPKKIFNLYR